ncbi:MAG: pyridoxamine 5'-phosphate oxidase family protein, partial [Sulfurihydrogenibium sp.]
MLNENLLKLLNDLTPSIFATTSEGKPYLAFVSWLIAKDENTIRVALSKNSKSVENVKSNPNVAISVFGPEIASTI